MALKHRLLGAAYHPLRLRNNLLRKLSKKPSRRIRVLIYHDIPIQQESEFKRQLQLLMKTWQFVDANQFALMLEGKIPIERDSVLLTFDDGFLSNRRIAESILKPLNIYAIFFIISGFASLTPGEDWCSFAAKETGGDEFLQDIYKRQLQAKWIDKQVHSNAKAIPQHCPNMNWKDLKWLLEAGHTIGAHTATHARL